VESAQQRGSKGIGGICAKGEGWEHGVKVRGKKVSGESAGEREEYRGGSLVSVAAREEQVRGDGCCIGAE
jgi:hypothetical protein